MNNFKKIITDLQIQLHNNLKDIKIALQNNPALSYSMINDLCSDINKKYGVRILLNFPEEKKIYDFESYGQENISVIIDRTRKRFFIDRNMIKIQIKKIFPNATIKDAYMYEGKEGLKIFLDHGRLDILPHSFHLWCKCNNEIIEFAEWLLVNVYRLYNGSYVISKDNKL